MIPASSEAPENENVVCAPDGRCFGTNRFQRFWTKHLGPLRLGEVGGTEYYLAYCQVNKLHGHYCSYPHGYGSYPFAYEWLECPLCAADRETRWTEDTA